MGFAALLGLPGVSHSHQSLADLRREENTCQGTVCAAPVKLSHSMAATCPVFAWVGTMRDQVDTDRLGVYSDLVNQRFWLSRSKPLYQVHRILGRGI